MNVAFLIGNGFDLNLDLKTSYHDFYKYYLSQDSSAEKSINDLRNNINQDIETWSDLELQLGKYTSKLQSLGDFDKAFFDIISHLSSYLQTVQDEIDFSLFDSTVLFNDLINAERVLSQSEQNDLNLFSGKWSSQPIDIKLLTFNYTQTIEKIVGDNITGLEIGNKGGRKVYLRGIEHIHQYIGQNLVLGVNDVDQIENQELRQSQEVVESIVKPIHNQEQGHTRDNYCIQVISAANLIFIFGSSLGETDKFWWEKVGKRLREDCRLVIFTRGPKKDDKHVSFSFRKKRSLKERFLSMTNLSEEQKEKVKEKIYVGITRDLFNLAKHT